MAAVVGSGVRWESFLIFTLRSCQETEYFPSDHCLVSPIHSFIQRTMAIVNYSDNDEAPAFRAGVGRLRRWIRPHKALYWKQLTLPADAFRKWILDALGVAVRGAVVSNVTSQQEEEWTPSFCFGGLYCRANNADTCTRCAAGLSVVRRAPLWELRSRPPIAVVWSQRPGAAANWEWEFLFTQLFFVP